MLDPAGYGVVTISKAISIVNDGIGEAGVTTTGSGSAIIINGGANEVVNLRGLTLVGLGVGTTGILFNTGKALNVQGCKIGGFTGDGINVGLTGSASLSISDTISSGNTGRGIRIRNTGSGTVGAMLKRIEVSGNGSHGAALENLGSTGTLKGTIADSVASNNGGTGFFIGATTVQAPATLVLVDSQTVKNVIGVTALGIGATVFVGRTTITGNTNGWIVSTNGIVNSYGDNNVDDNNGSEAAMPLVLAK